MESTATTADHAEMFAPQEHIAITVIVSRPIAAVHGAVITKDVRVQARITATAEHAEQSVLRERVAITAYAILSARKVKHYAAIGGLLRAAISVRQRAEMIKTAVDAG